jgi:hypothetical protein
VWTEFPDGQAKFFEGPRAEERCVGVKYQKYTVLPTQEKESDLGWDDPARAAIAQALLDEELAKKRSPKKKKRRAKKKRRDATQPEKPKQPVGDECFSLHSHEEEHLKPDGLSEPLAQLEADHDVTAPLSPMANELEAASDLCCPISLEIMRDPVVAADGFSYERAAIEQWLQKSNASPKTGLELEHRFLTSNRTLKTIIQDFVHQ